MRCPEPMTHRHKFGDIVMGHFATTGKSYADGGTIDGFAGIDHMSFGATSTPDVLNQVAPDSVLDNGVTKRFLFWDTGRQITNYRHVRWTFTNSGNWSTWNAVAWYGTPSSEPGQPIIEVDSYWANNGPLAPTPVEAASEAGVPGGQTAWPWMGHDHQVRTEWGAGSIDAKSDLASPGGATLWFSSLVKLVFGGIATGVFDENDADIPPGGVVTGVESVTGQSASFAHNEGGTIIAAYVTPTHSHSPFHLIDPGKLYRKVWPWEEIVDPATLIDIIRERGLADPISRLRGSVGDPVDEIERLVGAATSMTKSQLKTAVAELRSIVSRGEAGLKSLQAQTEKLQ